MEENKYPAEEIFSEKVRAGKRTYYFDVRATRSKDYFLTITEITKKFHNNVEGVTFEKHKIFLYKEDFHKFRSALENSINFMKEKLMPNIDFSQYEEDSDNTGIKKDSTDKSTNSDTDLKWD